MFREIARQYREREAAVAKMLEYKPDVIDRTVKFGVGILYDNISEAAGRLNPAAHTGPGGELYDAMHPILSARAMLSRDVFEKAHQADSWAAFGF